LSVAEHAKDKEYQLKNITGIFTQAMKNKWPGRLYYVDPFSGPGKCVIRDSDEETEGSPMIAAGKPFTNYYFADSDARSIDALKERVKRLNLSEAQVYCYTGDASETIGEMLKELPTARESLGLAFLDPWAWHFSFEDLKKLTRGRRLDVLINFNIGDMKRRWWELSPKMDSFLNLSTDHREFFKTEKQSVPDSRTLLDHYEKELGKIGYGHIADDRPVTNSTNTPLYHLIFGSKHPLGKQLRDEVSRKTRSGQIKMFE
jgi:three-Cys-motif partner protein